jgi:7-cyano-7-deazaguanine synthase
MKVAAGRWIRGVADLTIQHDAARALRAWRGCGNSSRMPEDQVLIMYQDSALVLFSGGQDSTTCLAWALSRYVHVETIGFAYGQRHAIELSCRAPIRHHLSERSDWRARLGPDHLVDIDMAAMGETALTAETAIATTNEGLPNTFVPGRNLLFLTYAAIVAYRRGIRRLIGGMCETDYSGYPDCRDDTIKAMQLALNLGMQRRFVLETPLMWRDKAATWELALALGGPALIDLIVEHTHSCYLADRSHRHEWGYGCGTCPACELRASGWRRWREQAVGQISGSDRS